MKHKRLKRESWGFGAYPYYQTRLDLPYFHGYACLLRLTECRDTFWSFPIADEVQVTGSGMTWMELIPDGTHHVITIKYFPDGKCGRQTCPPTQEKDYLPSLWYVDITDGTYTDTDGVLVYIDKYLDVIFTPEGDVKIDDRDELEEAYGNAALSREQYENALAECGRVVDTLCADIPKTADWCAAIRKEVEKRLYPVEKQ